MPPSLSPLFQEARAADWPAGETLFLAGQAVEAVFLVLSGRVHLQRHTPDGARLILQDAGPGDILAEASAYSARYHCDAVVVTATTLASLPKPVFLAALREDADLGEAWSSLLARSVQAARLRAEIRSLPRVADRLNAWLGEGNRLPERGRRQDVAAELGVTREALYRELARRRTERPRP
ncbi:MAG: Crp/Fnr family transcriptional regulator [Paracoccaceae bacterium]